MGCARMIELTTDGPEQRAFHLPHSLHTVNHLLSNYFEHVLPMLPIVQ